MSRARRPDDWQRDLDGARPVERQVAEALAAHPQVSHLADFTGEMDALDFRFRFEGGDVHLDVKAKHQRSSRDVAEQWPDVHPDDLFVLDETSFRTLVWNEGAGYLVVLDGPRQRWHVFGPWELCLGPRRRYERRGDRGAGEFLKGKLLLDLRTAAASSPELRIDEVLDVVRRSRATLHQVRAVPIRGRGELPVIPRAAGEARAAAASAPDAPSVVEGDESDRLAIDPRWAGLSPELVAAIERRWGWRNPTSVQAAAFPAILGRQNTLVLGPTAGGKTEAALLPLLDLWRGHGWRGHRPSILAISPLRALIDDQLTRWRDAGALVGATAFAWHGDVDRDAKNAFKDVPADALITTPESLELLLSSTSHDEQRLFAGLQAVVVDEVHAFVGTARGAQLVSLIERLDRFVDADLQRVGLSATVAHPEEVLSWLAGGSHRQRVVVGDTSPVQGEHLEVRTYGEKQQATTVIGGAAEGHRALIFVRSRRRAEEIAHGLDLPVHHGSMAGDQRSDALRRLVDGEVSAIVATSTLEMGIDVGDLDIVVHDGAPTSPSSYLQRLGRAGRRTGDRRLTFTTGAPDDLILALAVVARARRGDLGRLPPERGARLVLGQQAVALTVQQFISDRRALRDTLRWSPVFAGLDRDIEMTIEHLLAGRWLMSDGERLVLGPEGQHRYGGSGGIRRLLATFQAGDGASVIDEQGRLIGVVDWTVLDPRPGRESGFVLGGQAWTIVRIEQGKSQVVVRPGHVGHVPSWRGAMLEVERETWEAVREVLAGTEVPIVLDDRARHWLEEERQSWQPRLAKPVRDIDGTTELNSFAGVSAHRGVLNLLGSEGVAEGASLRIEAPLQETRRRARALLDDLDAAIDDEARRVAPKLAVAHAELVAAPVLLAEARAFHVDAEGILRVLTMLAEP